CLFLKFFREEEPVPDKAEDYGFWSSVLVASLLNFNPLSSSSPPSFHLALAQQQQLDELQQAEDRAVQLFQVSYSPGHIFSSLCSCFFGALKLIICFGSSGCKDLLTGIILEVGRKAEEAENAENKTQRSLLQPGVKKHSGKVPQAQLIKLLHKFLLIDKSQAFPPSGEVYRVVTNYHVVAKLATDGSGSHHCKVYLADAKGNGFYREGKIVGVDPAYDLAILKVDAEGYELKPVVLGTSQTLLVGRSCFAIGNPYGYENTLTTGVVSGLGREIPSPNGSAIRGAIQTDADINAGKLHFPSNMLKVFL
ncbi:uncharacterized protein LOC122278423, partial [Carya illinoinensis]|uniref:uncharacterized protein LOC122278423 n=1 Tax=Carya illinoinensis TaxID=32201 RepID=UPI001C7246EF